jgi:transposase
LPERLLIVFEATGIYSRPVEKFFQDHYFSYCLLNPLEAKKQMKKAPYAVGKQINRMPIGSHRLILKINVSQKKYKAIFT